MSTITELLGIDHLAKSSIQEAMGTMTVTDLAAAVLGIVNLQTDKFITAVKPTQDRVNTTLDKVDGLIDSAKRLLDRIAGKP